jgi:hypothetical protein
MNLTNEEIKFIKELSHEMKTQDNRSTAQPFCLMLEEEVERILPDGFGDNILIRWNDESYYEDDFKELKEELLEDGYQEIEKLNDFEEMKDFAYGHEDMQTFAYTKEHEVKSNTANFFLTEKAYNEHLKTNKHNLNNPKSFGIHLHRNWEMENLFKIIHKLAESL